MRWFGGFFGVALSLITGFCLLQLPKWPLLERLEWLLYDVRLALANGYFPQRVSMDRRIVVVGVGPESYKAIPEHPVFWVPHYTRVARAALEHGALTVGLDYLPTYVAPEAIGPFAQLATEYPDRLVMIAYWDSQAAVTTPPDPLVMVLGAHNLALANLSLDQDAVARAQSIQSVQTQETVGRTSWSFLAAALVEKAQQRPLPAGLASAGQGRAYTNLSATPPRQVAFHDVLAWSRAGQKEHLRQVFADSLVLIGSRAKVDQDLVLTPNPQWKPGGSLTQSGFGVDYQAQVANTLLTQQTLRAVPAWQSGLALAALLLLLLLAAQWASLGLNLFLLGGSLLLWLSLALAALLGASQLLPLTPGIVGLPSCWAAAMAYRSWRESRARQKLHRTIAGYVAPEILREMLAEPATWLRSLDQRREVTILFSDINDFSTTSERESPEVVAEWLNQHYREMAHVIFQHQGTIIRFVGDQFMVLFGSPKPLQRPESAAVACALAMHQRLRQLRDSSSQGGFFEVKIGIHRGSMLLAVIGDDLKREYTAIGDEANLAARIQDLCKSVGQSILLSQEIVDRLQEGQFVVTDQGEWEVKGRRQKVRVYGVSAGESPANA